MDENQPLRPEAAARAGARLAALSRWVDAADAGRDPEARTWGLIAKLAEESGEAAEAFADATRAVCPRDGAPPAPGRTGKELLDVAVAALAAYEHLDGNRGASLDRMAERLACPPAEAGQRLAALSRLSGAADAGRDPEARAWRRIAEVAAAAGKAVQAYIGATGQNPRKGRTHTLGDVGRELLGVAVAALAAYEHLDGDRGASVGRMAGHLAGLLARAGIAAPAGAPAAPDAPRAAAAAA